MRTGRTVSSCGHGVGGMALAGLTVLTAACASGGGALHTDRGGRRNPSFGPYGRVGAGRIQQ